MTKSRPKKKRYKPSDYERVEHDLAYWLEHVTHWFLLLVVLVFSVALGLTFI